MTAATACTHFWESWLDEEQWQCCYCGKHEAIVNPDAIAAIEAERDAALAVLQQLVAADDERKRLDGSVDLLTPETHRAWEMAYERADQAFDDAFDAARRLLANGAPDNAAQQ